MGIRKEQPGAATAAAVAGTAIGAGQKAVRQQAQAEQARQQQVAIKAREAAEQRAFQWEQQKMEINSQRAFERELRAEDYRLMAEDRAAERAIERIELSKDLDFQYKTQERQRKIEVIDNSEAALDKAIERGEHTEDELAVRNKRSEYRARRQAIELGETYRESKPRSAVSQAAEIGATIDAAYELEGYTAQDLRDVGLDPADFPGVAADEGGYSVGQIVSTSQGNMQVVGFDTDGEPMVEPVEEPRSAAQSDESGKTPSFQISRPF